MVEGSGPPAGTRSGARVLATVRGEKARLRLQGLPRRPAELSSALRLLGELRRLGWQRSVVERRPVDESGLPVPWLNYSAASALAGLVGPETRVFEYGCGYSTAWLAERSGDVHAVEHDRAWFVQLDKLLDASAVDIRLIDCEGDALDAPAGDSYVEAPARLAAERPFDVVIIDGMARRSCLEQAERILADDGVVVLDDTERPELARAGRSLIEGGRFRQFDLHGPKPGMGHLTTTTFYLRRGVA